MKSLLSEKQVILLILLPKLLNFLYRFIGVPTLNRSLTAGERKEAGNHTTQKYMCDFNESWTSDQKPWYFFLFRNNISLSSPIFFAVVPSWRGGRYSIVAAYPSSNVIFKFQTYSPDRYDWWIHLELVNRASMLEH